MSDAREWADDKNVAVEDGLKKEIQGGFPHGQDAVVSILVVSACLLPAAFPLTPNLESLVTGTCSLPLRR
jgi:hypothetical protein